MTISPDDNVAMPGKDYTPLASQKAALANPAAAPLSTAPAATPDIASPSPEERKKGQT